MRIVQISDTHISQHGGDTRANLERIIDFVNDELRPDFVVHTGDVVILDPDVAEDRVAAREALARIQAPLKVLPGNHDVGETFAAAWAGLHATPERVQAFVDDFGPDHWIETVGDFALVGLNSEILGADFAESTEQWAWIEQLPELVGDRPVLLFCHKPVFPPFPGELEHQMSIPAEALERLRPTLAALDVKAYGSGHLHRYQLEREGAAWLVSAPAVGFTSGDPTSMPGLHQLGVVEYELDDDGEVTPAFRSVPGLIEGGAMENPLVVQAFAALGQDWEPVEA